MSYYIYPKLRAIFSILPEKEDIESLMKVENTEGFTRRIKNMKIVERFPLEDKDMESYLKLIPYGVACKVKKQIPGSSSRFFKLFLKRFQLEDIKNILRGGEGFFTDSLAGRKFSEGEIEDYISGKFWEEGWDEGYPRYMDSGNRIEIESSLDKIYYMKLLDSVDFLPGNERVETEDLIIKLIDFKNKLWAKRLKENYKLEGFEIRRFLIPYGNYFEGFDGSVIDSSIKLREKYIKMYYEDFKMKMFTMRSIIAFFLLLISRMDVLISIYRGKMLNISRERTIEILEVF